VIASVSVTKSRTPRTDEEQSSLNRSLMPVYSRVRQAEGCEGLLVLRDSATGDAFTIILWRDQTAMDSGVNAFSEDPVQAETFQRGLETLGIEVVGEPRIHDVTTNI
jgi:hypothetical protein